MIFLPFTVVLRSLLTCTLVTFATLLWADDTTLNQQTPAVELASVFAAVAPLQPETGNNTLLYNQYGDVPTPIASVTKLMTAMVILDSGQPLNEWLTINKRQTETDKNAWSRLRIGSRAKRSDLLLISLMSSENLAADVLAQHYPGGLESFVQAMNDKADALGMTNSRFTGPAGLRPDNLSTAADLVHMVQAAYKYEVIRDYSTRSYHRVVFRHPVYALEYGNTNPLVRSHRWDVDLSKTGYLRESGRCLVMISRINDEPTVMVLLDSLGTRSPLGDAGRIRRWLETGNPGSLAKAAKDYRQQREAELELSTHFQ